MHCSANVVVQNDTAANNNSLVISAINCKTNSAITLMLSLEVKF